MQSIDSGSSSIALRLQVLIADVVLACVYVCGCVLVMAFSLVEDAVVGQPAPHCPVLWCVSFGISTQHILAAV